HIVWSRCGNSVKGVAARALVGAWHDAPLAAIPILHQRLVLESTAAGVIGPDSPHVIWSCYGYSVEYVFVRALIGARHDAPCAAVPPLLEPSTASRVLASPHIVWSRYRYAVQDVVRPLVRARHDRPVVACGRVRAQRLMLCKIELWGRL